MTIKIGLFALGIFIGGVLTGLITYIVLSRKTAQIESASKSAEAINNELRQQLERKSEEMHRLQEDFNNESQVKSALEAKLFEAEKNIHTMEKELLDKFNTISLEALSKNSEEFLKLAEEKLKMHTTQGTKELDGKKQLIDRSIEEIDRTLSAVKEKIETVGRGNVEITTLIKKHEDVTHRLRDTTEHLRQALASSKKRGEWGERMAEDIINLAGLVEGVNYSKQKTLEGSSGRPDYTFIMPNKLKINMDVKFPLDNYMHYLNAESEHDRKRFRDDLLRNTRIMIKQVTGRDYINPADNTVDYVLVFIPNEQVYGFINESDRGLMDEALKQKVVLCSPFTLYAILAVIRQAVENFNLERTASGILELLGEFSKQWGAYKDKFRSMGEKLDAARREFDMLMTTRSNMLERPLKKIDALKAQQAIELQPDNGEDKGA